jgi:hypothetical protein
VSFVPFLLCILLFQEQLEGNWQLRRLGQAQADGLRGTHGQAGRDDGGSIAQHKGFCLPQHDQGEKGPAVQNQHVLSGSDYKRLQQNAQTLRLF